MRLSTSNSDERNRMQFWGRVWLLTFMITLGVLGGWEGFWRLNDFDAGLEDDWGVWAAARRAASRRQKDVVVLIGSSRIQVGLHPDVFARLTGRQPVMLAIDGSSPLAVLENLAADSKFSGTVICSLIPMWLAETKEHGDRSAKWIRKYRAQNWSARVHTHLSKVYQQIFVFRYPGLTPARIWTHILEQTWPQPPYAPMGPNRYRPADFSKVDAEKLREARERRQLEIHKKANPLYPNPFAARIEKIEKMVERIKIRGGQVIFIRLPSTGVVRGLEQKTWPREVYWDVFSRKIKTLAIHFEDYPSLMGFDCPDGSHLDVKDAKKFSQGLIAILKAEGLFVTRKP